MWEFVSDGDGDGYRWLLYGRPGEPILASWLSGMNHLGGGMGVTAAMSALAVLTEAVEEGNVLAGYRAAAAADSAALELVAALLRNEAAGEKGPNLPGAIGEIVRATGRTA